MSRPDLDQPDPDDMFSDTRMSFGDHIDDLRTHLMRALKGFLFFVAISFILAKPVLRFIASPVEEQLLAYQKDLMVEKGNEIRDSLQLGMFKNVPPVLMDLRFDFNQLESPLRERLGLPPAPPEHLQHLLPALEEVLERAGGRDLYNPLEVPGSRWLPMRTLVANPVGLAQQMLELNLIVKPPTLSTLSVEEAFVVYFKIALLTGFVLSSPWVFFQVWSFVAAGLYQHEKRLVNVYLPFSLLLMFAGVIVCQFFVIPKAIEALLWFNKILGLQPDLRLSEWLGFAIFMPVVFGVSFQTPLVMLMLYKIGIFSAEAYREKRRIAWFFMGIFAAVITPSTDAVSMLLLLVPMGLLYELGILLCTMYPRTPLFEFDQEEQEEMVEV